MRGLIVHRRRTTRSPTTVEDGYAAPSTTVVRGRVVLRLCTINPRTTFEDVDATLDVMARQAR